MLLLQNGTALLITPLSGVSSLMLTPYSARGLTQTYEVILGGSGEGQIRRDVNAVARFVGDTRFRKYRTTITCKDGETPCLDDAWIGQTCEVNCVFEFSYLTGGSPARPVVPGSERFVSGITYYRPVLSCIVETIKVALPEYPALYDWQIDMVEV